MNQTTIILICLAVAFGWCLLCYLVSVITGWGALAGRYPAQTVPRGTTFRLASLGTCRLGGYNNALTAVVSDQGLYFSVFSIFRLGHPPMLIPWEAVAEVTEGKILNQTVTSIVLHHEQTRLLTGGRLGEAILEQAKKRGLVREG
jgi:hypothetical protein